MTHIFLPGRFFFFATTRVDFFLLFLSICFAYVDLLGTFLLACAGLDVFEREPEIHEGLLDLDNVTMTPHIGSAEVRFREAMTQMVADNAGAILAGETPPNRVA